MPSLIHHSQADFTLGRSAPSNIREVLTVLEQARANPSSDLAILSRGREGLWYCQLSLVVIGPPEIWFWWPLPLHKGTRQGCPLSPLFFNLALKSLSHFLLFHSNLHVAMVGQQEVCTALFADDILIFTSDPKSDMPHIQDIFTQFRVCSGLRINFSKSEILPLYHAWPPPWTAHSTLSVAKTHITYLGIKIGKAPSSLYHLNYPPVISKSLGN